MSNAIENNEIFINLNLCIIKEDSLIITSNLNSKFDYNFECDLRIMNTKIHYMDLLNALLNKIEPIIIDNIDYTQTTENFDHSIEKININTSSEEELKNIKGMKLIYIKKILKLRDNNVFIRSPEDLRNKIGMDSLEVNEICKQISFDEVENNVTGRFIDL